MTWQSSLKLWEGPHLSGSSVLWGDLEVEVGLHQPHRAESPSQPAPPASPQGKLSHRVMLDCSSSHSLHIVPKYQGDSLLGESLLAPCCWELGSAAS